MIINIISNAVKYTPDGGKIDVLMERNGDKIDISVSDTGIGIPQEDLDRIFDRFYRVDKARSREYGGTGLGLAITREIVEYHKGKIRVDSTLSVGTTVHISLSIAQDGSDVL